MLRTRRIASLAGTVALAALSLTACGGAGDDSASPATSAERADEPTPTSVVEPDEPVDTDAPSTASPDAGSPDTAPPDTGSSATSSGDAAGSGEPAQSDPPVAVPEALQVVAPTIDGGELDLATLASRPVLLWFWAPF